MLETQSLPTVSNFKAAVAERCREILSLNEKPKRQTPRLWSTHEDINPTQISPKSGNFNFDMAKILRNDTALLCTYLEQRFLRRNTFHKFSEPAPHHPLYREGDSMCEEVHMRRKKFNREFAKVGVKYTSKSAYFEALKRGNLFRGKLYLSYYDRDTNLTHYFRNDPVADVVFPRTRQLPIEEAKVSPFSRKLKYPSDASQNQENPCNGQNGHYAESELASPLYTVFNNNLILREDSHTGSDKTQGNNAAQTSVTLSTDKPNVKSEELARRRNDTETVTSRHANSARKDKKPEEQTHILSEIVKSMLSIWKTWVGKPIGEGDSQTITKDLAQRMEATLNTYCSGDLEKWSAICIRIARSKYLMGEGGSKWNGAYLSWVLKSENLENILNKKGFVYDDRDIPKTAKQQRIEFRQHQLREQHATLINRKDTLTSEILYAREALLRQAVCEITDAQKADVFLMFVEDENQKGNPLQTETNATPWDQLSYLDGLLWTSFLSQWISKSLFQGDVTEEVERQLLEEKTADRLREVEQELAELALQYRGMALGDVAQDTSATAPEDTPKAIATSEQGTPEMLTQKMTINFHATQDAISVNSWENIEFRKALHEILGLTYIPSAYEVSVFEVCTPMSFLSLIGQKRCESDTTQDKKYALC